MIHGLHSLAWMRVRMDRPAEAEGFFRQALDVEQRILGPRNTSVAETSSYLGTALRLQGRLDEAERMFERSLDMWTEALGEKHQTRAGVMRNMAELALDRGQDAKALETLRQAVVIYESALSPEHPHVGNTLVLMSTAHVRRGELASADSVLQHAHRILSLHYEEDDARMKRVHDALAALYQAWGNRTLAWHAALPTQSP